MSDGPVRSKGWPGEEGVDYVERNPATVEEMDALKVDTYGVTQRAITERYVGDVPRDARVLEVGCNRGIQLEILRLMGFSDLTGVDVSRYALERGREQFADVEFVEGDARNLPFEDDAFDLVFTVGTLITIPPEEVGLVLRELTRVSNRHVWGLEFYDEEYTAIEDRGLYWKSDFPSLFEKLTNATVTEREYLGYVDEDVVDISYRLSAPEE